MQGKVKPLSCTIRTIIVSAGTDSEFVTVRAVGNMKWDLDNKLYNNLLVPKSYLSLCIFINTISQKEKGICENICQ